MHAFDALNRLRLEGRLGECSLMIPDESSPRKARRVFGRDIVQIARSSVRFRGGETGHESISLPMNSVQEIELGGRILYMRKKRIDRIYPRG